jgi:hypothetical protein
MSIVFILTRHVISERTNKLWQECVRSIRRSYPTDPILIIDDHSNPDFLSTSDSLEKENILNISSEFPPGYGEILAYYYFYKMKIADTAIILHDSFWIQEPIPGLEEFRQNPHFRIRYLLHFNIGHHDLHQETVLLKTLQNSEAIIHYYYQSSLKKYGCQGMQSIISHLFVTEMQEKYHFFNTLPFIISRYHRMSMERVFAAICNYMCPELFDISRVSVYGDFFKDCVDKYEYTDYDFFIANREKITQQKRPFIKIFSGR